jgi:predicted RNA-binding protein YlqC (UPF0109 family)
MTLNFSQLGTRRKPDGGLYFPSECGQYALYHSDQVYGIPVREPIWLAIEYQSVPCGRVIGRKRSRNGAIRAAVRHCRATRGQRVEVATVKRGRARRPSAGPVGAGTRQELVSVGPATQGNLF